MKKMGFIRALQGILTVVTVLLAGCLSVSATEEEMAETLPAAYGELEEVIPPEISDLLPEQMFSRDPQQALEAAETVTRPAYFLRVVLEMTGLYMGEIITLMVTLMGLLLLSALLRHLKDILPRSGEGFGFCLRLCMYTVMVTRAGEMLSWVETYFERLGTLMNAMIPVMGVLYTLGGNIGQAAVNSELLLLMLRACEYIASSLTPALCGICLAFALMEAFGGSGQLRLAPLSGLCKKWYTTLLGFLTFLLTASLSVQSLLAVKADTLSMRGVKYAVGNILPVVGGAVSGTLGSVAAGVGLLRGVAGVSGVVLVALLLLPTLIQLLLLRACYQLTAAMAGMLSCDGEARLLGEVGSLYGYMAAAVSICAVGFLIALAVFAHGATAIGGM